MKPFANSIVILYFRVDLEMDKGHVYVRYFCTLPNILCSRFNRWPLLYLSVLGGVLYFISLENFRAILRSFQAIAGEAFLSMCRSGPYGFQAGIRPVF